MQSDEKIQVFIAHGNPLVAAGLQAAFSAREDLRVIECCGPDAVLDAAECVASPIIAVADWHSGMRVMAADTGRTCRVLIVTDDDSELSIRRAVELGARGYLPLSSSVETVACAVRSIHSGGTALDALVMNKIAMSLASPTLTGREMEVLRLMMEGLPNKAIAFTLNRSVGTAKSHVKAILSKLDVASRVEAVAVAQRRGLVRESSRAQVP